MRLEVELAHDVAPARGVGGDDLGELRRRRDDRVDPDPRQPVLEGGAFLRGDDLAGERVDDLTAACALARRGRSR
jgi:hypothetical protein